MASNINGQTGLGAWIAYTPTVTASSGALTSYTATGRYKRTGNTVLVTVDVTLTNIGTGSIVLNITVPFLAANHRFVINGFERAVTGVQCFGSIAANTGYMGIVAYNNTYVILTNSNVIMTGEYEAA